jgi:hypothetical protein
MRFANTRAGMTEKGTHSLSLSFSRAWLPRAKNPGLFWIEPGGEKIDSLHCESAAEHDAVITSSLIRLGCGIGMWDEEDGFFYDAANGRPRTRVLQVRMRTIEPWRRACKDAAIR